MKTVWSEERLGYQPSQFEKVNGNTYIQRRNIHRDTLTEDSMESEPGWVCEARFISDDIYEDFMEVMNSPAQEQIVNNFTTIQNKQAGTDENTITLMLGAADLYEKLEDISGKLDSLTRKEG